MVEGLSSSFSQLQVQPCKCLQPVCCLCLLCAQFFLRVRRKLQRFPISDPDRLVLLVSGFFFGKVLQRSPWRFLFGCRIGLGRREVTLGIHFLRGWKCLGLGPDRPASHNQGCLWLLLCIFRLWRLRVSGMWLGIRSRPSTVLSTGGFRICRLRSFSRRAILLASCALVRSLFRLLPHSRLRRFPSVSKVHSHKHSCILCWSAASLFWCRQARAKNQCPWQQRLWGVWTPWLHRSLRIRLREPILSWQPRCAPCSLQLDQRTVLRVLSTRRTVGNVSSTGPGILVLVSRLFVCRLFPRCGLRLWVQRLSLWWTGRRVSQICPSL